MKAAVPLTEAQRLEALRSYRILDSEAEQEYDDIACLAARICEVPMSTISLVDESRQWFKSTVGLEVRETPREVAFCAHTILRQEPMIVADATKDGRFSNNQFVVHEPRIRFYAGFPLIDRENNALGSLCAIDRKPRELSSGQIKAMQGLARQVMTLLELRRVSGQLAAFAERVKILEGLLPMCAWCKSVRDDQGYYRQVETYLKTTFDIQFTHGICPRCLEKERARFQESAVTL